VTDGNLLHGAVEWTVTGGQERVAPKTLSSDRETFPLRQERRRTMPHPGEFATASFAVKGVAVSFSFISGHNRATE
jgi:hypothetical protein